jgi:hypothetical protein
MGKFGALWGELDALTEIRILWSERGARMQTGTFTRHESRKVKESVPVVILYERPARPRWHHREVLVVPCSGGKKRWVSSINVVREYASN